MYLTSFITDRKFLAMVTTGISSSCCRLGCRQLWVSVQYSFWKLKDVVDKSRRTVFLGLSIQVGFRCHLFSSYFLCMCSWHKQCNYDPFDCKYFADQKPWNWECRRAWWPSTVGAAKTTWPCKMTELQLHRISKPWQPHLGKEQNAQVYITGTQCLLHFLFWDLICSSSLSLLFVFTLQIYLFLPSLSCPISLPN